MRAIKPSKVDSKVYQTLAKVDDPFGYWMISGFMGIFAVIFGIGFAIDTSLWFLLLLLLPVPTIIVGLMTQLNTISSEYSWHESIYTRAYTEYTKIIGDKTVPHKLLTSIWTHERAVGKGNHERSWQCVNCVKRAELITEFAEDSLSGPTGTDDIQFAQRALEQRREAAVIQNEIRKELGL